MKNQMVRIITILVSVALSSFLLAANVPNIGDIEQQIKVPDIKKEQQTIPLIKTKEYKAPMIDSGKKTLIKDYKITGNDSINTSEFEKFYMELKNTELTFNQLQNIASSITKHYREKGYFVTRAYIPAQNILENNNILEIAVIEGKYGEFHIKNNSLIKDSIVQGMFDKIKDENIISTSALERTMLIINDTPGAIVTTTDVMPGALIGTSDFAITTQTDKVYDGYIILDNTGSRYTGKNRIMAGVNFNSLAGIGDKLSLSGLVSNGADLINGRVTYSAPLMANGLRGEISYSKTTYSLVEEYKNLDAKGNSVTLEATLTYPIIRSRGKNFYTSLTIIKKDLKDEVASTNDITKKDTNSLKLGLSYDKNYLAFGLHSNSQIKVNYTYGTLSFDDATKKATDEAGANTKGNYSKVNLELAHYIILNQGFSLESFLKMQYTLGNKNLDGSEDFSIGGSNGVKLYPDGELSAENGYLFSTELKYKLPNIDALSSQVGIFYDRGKAFMADNTVGFETKSLQDIGIGYYANYKDFFGQLQVAWIVNSEAVSSEPASNSRILFQGGWVF